MLVTGATESKWFVWKLLQCGALMTNMADFIEIPHGRVIGVFGEYKLWFM